MKKVGTWAAALAMAVVGCGGGGGSSGPSRVAAHFEGKRDLKLDGLAFAVVVNTEKSDFAAANVRLGVYIFAANTTPAPTCEVFAREGALGQLTRGGFVAFTIAKVPEGPGKIEVAEVAALLGDADKGEMFMSGGKAQNMTITLTTYDSKSFSGDITTTAGAATTATGTISGTVCPAQTSTNRAQAVPADPSSGVDPTDAAPAEATPPPPEPPPATKPKPKPKPKSKPMK